MWSQTVSPLASCWWCRWPLQNKKGCQICASRFDISYPIQSPTTMYKDCYSRFSANKKIETVRQYVSYVQLAYDKKVPLKCVLWWHDWSNPMIWTFFEWNHFGSIGCSLGTGDRRILCLLPRILQLTVGSL